MRTKTRGSLKADVLARVEHNDLSLPEPVGGEV
jgi:hypothetical protein